MPREFVISSPEPITVIEIVTAANTIDPGFGVGRLWKGGGIQVASDESLVLAVLRSSAIENADDTQRMLGTLPVDAAYLTETYGPFNNDTTESLVQELAKLTGGTVFASEGISSAVFTPGGLYAEISSYDALVRAVLSELPPGYERIDLDYSAVGPDALASTRATRPDAPDIPSRNLSRIYNAAEALRSAMYRDWSGTWFSMKMTITAEGSVDTAYNYDGSPWSTFEFAPDAYISDLAQFPRDDVHMPGWLRDIVEAEFRASGLLAKHDGHYPPVAAADTARDSLCTELAAGQDDENSLLAEPEALDQVGRSMLALAGGEFARLELDYSEVGSVSQSWLGAVRHDGTKTSFPEHPEVKDAIERLRPLMYRAPTGTWWSANVVVTSRGTLDATYNYDNPPWSRFDYGPATYVEDLGRFPRDDANIPDWLRRILDSGM